MLRGSWHFTYWAKDLIEPTQAMYNYHKRHAEHWESEKDRLEAKIRETGIKLSELQVTGGSQFRTEVNQAMAEEYNVASTKARMHQSLADQYFTSLLAFRLNPESDLMLDVEDINFFRLSVGPPKE